MVFFKLISVVLLKIISFHFFLLHTLNRYHKTPAINLLKLNTLRDINTTFINP